MCMRQCSVSCGTDTAEVTAALQNTHPRPNTRLSRNINCVNREAAFEGRVLKEEGRTKGIKKEKSKTEAKSQGYSQNKTSKVHSG